MRQLRHPAQAVVILAVLAGTPTPGASQNVDTTLARIERLIVAGDRSSARVLADSLIASLAPESPQLADALYWRAASASSAAEAERDYLRVSIEHSLSRRAPDALLALAQLEFARGDRVAARRRLDRLLRDYPSGKHVVRASLQSGRLAIEAGEPAAGCATLNAARLLVPSDDIELRNQFDYYVAQCTQLPPDTVATPPTPVPAPATGGIQYSVQVAAFTARVEATALATRLRERGFDVRIVGSQAPYRVRIGRYPTRAEATAALARMRAAKVSGIVVEAEPR
jgi:hypothetical protein